MRTNSHKWDEFLLIELSVVVFAIGYLITIHAHNLKELYNSVQTTIVYNILCRSKVYLHDTLGDVSHGGYRNTIGFGYKEGCERRA